MARIKTVFPTDEIAHLWAHQSAPHARNPAHNFWFNGPVIYSYGGHFPIARIVTKDDGSRMVLCTTRGYSVTTSRHIHRVRMAIPSYQRRIDVPYVAEESRAGDNVAALVADVRTKLLKAHRARGTNKDYYMGEARSIAENARFLAEWYGLPAPIFPALDAQGAKEIAAAARAVAEEEARQAAAKRERYLIEHSEQIIAWLGGDTSIYTRTAWRAVLGTDHLRVSPDNPDEVETSQGVRVPLADVRRAWSLIERFYRESTGQPLAAGKAWRIGRYTLDSIERDGTVHVGCHSFIRAEVERFAHVLGLVRGPTRSVASA